MTDSQSKPDLRWIFVVQLYLACLIWGVVQVFTQNGSAYLGFSILNATLVATWVVIDARRREIRIHKIVLVILFLFWPIAVPIYLIMSRGLRGLGWAFLHAFGLLAATYLGFCCGLFVATAVNGFDPQT
jgi:hypothetical protein